MVALVVRHRIVVTGVVQGVGFRPHVARLAARHGLTGWCRNSSTAVTVEVQGAEAAVEAFRAELVEQAPPLAKILTVRHDVRPVLLAPDNPDGTDDTADATGPAAFAILASDDAPGGRTLVPPDVATCDDCLAELRDPNDRRFGHPFITCTNCGPRLTIITDVPYDRPATSMARFPMCAACAREYADPADRRYHAQPIACPGCGPRLVLSRPSDTDPAGEPLDAGRDAADAARLLGRVRAALLAGQIVAIKGIGGYHLAVDARREDAVARLRHRKHRPHQPFALMACDLATVGAIAELNPAAEALLTDPARPIVILHARPDAPGAAPRVAPGLAPRVAPGVAPGLAELGVMLPYAPVHHLLLDDELPLLVLTSGNVSGEPLVTRDDEALARLGGIADLILAHDREIVVPCEDSVWMLDGDEPLPVRRSRGYAPLPVVLRAGPETPPVDAPVVLAAGAEVKNTVALARDGWAFVSGHVGDLETLSARRHYEATAAALVAFHRRAPDVVAADAHPGYASRAWAVAAAEAYGVPLVAVQHHHAHLAALAAEHGLLGGEPVLGIVADGTGYGCDETIWGGELLLLTDGGATAKRLGHLRPWPLPGGDSGVRHPSRQAVGALAAAGIDAAGTVPHIAAGASAATLAALVTGSRGWVATSSAGRLFDVAAALLGVRQDVTYEAQAAIELEALARTATEPAPFPRPLITSDTGDTSDSDSAPHTSEADGHLMLDPRPALAVLADVSRRTAADGWVADPGSAAAGSYAAERYAAWALGFHEWMAAGLAELAARAASRYGIATVGLTGGCFQNRLLLSATRRQLATRGLTTLTHRVVPPNDGGLSLGQCAVAAARHHPT
ncbi:MAG: carbamoyltransferase HypF [Austwickia sp.]|nr:MAG: carbamoyltransferase HypF [Austwickia sp.]